MTDNHVLIIAEAGVNPVSYTHLDVYKRQEIYKDCGIGYNLYCSNGSYMF